MALQWKPKSGKVIPLTAEEAAIVYPLTQKNWFKAMDATQQTDLIRLLGEYKRYLRRIAKYPDYDPDGEKLARALLEDTKAKPPNSK